MLGSCLLKPRQNILLNDFNVEAIGEEANICQVSVAVSLDILDVLFG